MGRYHVKLVCAAHAEGMDCQSIRRLFLTADSLLAESHSGRITSLEREDYHLKLLAIISLKMRFSSDEFAKCVVEAYKNENSMIRDLAVSFRGSKDKTAFFLFTYRGKNIDRFPLPIDALRNTGHLRYYLEHYRKRLEQEKEYEAL